jgi:hypothetical protein
MERRIEKKQNFFAIELREAEEVKIFVNGIESVCFISPIDGFLNCYLKRETKEIQFK